MLTALFSVIPAFAGGFPLRVEVDQQVCVDADTVELHLAVTHGSYSEPIYQWDFDADRVWDTAPNIDPTEVILVPDDSVVTVAVGARNAIGQRAHDVADIETIACE